MENIYKDIAARTGGDIYIGIVGPVRTGKSTFIKKFMETLVLPNIENGYSRVRALDELPQSAAGRTIMTTEPKFVPEDAVELKLSENAVMRIRMIDCVGYMVKGALGCIENGAPRMVRTPWSDSEMPFEEAAETGTEKVIKEHSTIGIVVTTDGSIGELPRENYVEAEERVIDELRAINKPFVVVVNTVDPDREDTKAICKEIAEKSGAGVIPLNCLNLDEEMIVSVLERVLFEFPITDISIDMPGWVNSLDSDHWLKTSIYESVLQSASSISKVKELNTMRKALTANENVISSEVTEAELGTGSITLRLTLKEDLFYSVLGEVTSMNIEDDADLIRILKEFAASKRKYDKVAEALEEAMDTGYGIVTPSMDELTLEEPEMVRQGGRYGVRLKASAPSVHMIRADIETEVSPIVGSERQSEDLVRYLLDEFEEDPKKIWDSNIFGKSLHELVNEGLHTKLSKMPEDARDKLRETLERIINEGSGGLICIIL